MKQKDDSPCIPEDYHHGLVHRERAARGMYLFYRSFVLDTLAQGIATDLASRRATTPCEFYGNIGKGNSFTLIHSTMMEERRRLSRKNSSSKKFTEFDIGIAVGPESVFSSKCRDRLKVLL
jgi:hypothetical protein